MGRCTVHRRIGTKRRIFHGVVLLVLVLGIFGIGAGWEMRTDQNGSMRDCVFTHATEQGLCPMQFSDHVTDWRLLFGSLPQLELLMVFFAITIGIVLLDRLAMQMAPAVLRFLWYERARVYQRLFAPLQSALARGIVQPKIYA